MTLGDEPLRRRGLAVLRALLSETPDPRSPSASSENPVAEVEPRGVGPYRRVPPAHRTPRMSKDLSPPVRAERVVARTTMLTLRVFDLAC